MLTCEHFHDDGKLLLGPLSPCSHPRDNREWSEVEKFSRNTLSPHNLIEALKTIRV